MTLADLQSTLVRARIYTGHWGMAKDHEYCPFTVDFVRDALPKWVETLPPALTVMVDLGGGKTARRPKWEPESGDCDNIVWDFLAYLSRCCWYSAVVEDKRYGNAAAGGLYYFHRPGDPKSAHDIAWFISLPGEVHFCDPATFEIDHLTPEQLATIFGGDHA